MYAFYSLSSKCSTQGVLVNGSVLSGRYGRTDGRGTVLCRIDNLLLTQHTTVTFFADVTDWSCISICLGTSSYTWTYISENTMVENETWSTSHVYMQGKIHWYHDCLNRVSACPNHIRCHALLMYDIALISFHSFDHDAVTITYTHTRVIGSL